MRRITSLGLSIALALASASALADSHPAGVTYPLKPAAVQPAGLAHPLPSTRRYVLVWKDQLADAVQTITAAQKQWIVTHYVGTQKVFKSQIDEYRTLNPNFLTLVYHLAYGLNGADQQNPVGNITGPNQYGQEDTDTFTPWVQSSGSTRENAYQHGQNTGFTNDRIYYPDPYWLMDLESNEWQSYLFPTLVTWQGYAASKADGVFLDVAFPPWYNYQPASWWGAVAGGSTRQDLINWWNPRAKAYFDAMRAEFGKSGHPRYLVIPNPDALIDGTDEPQFLEGTDGVFTENWQNAMGNAGDWNLSARRIVQYVTSQGKVWIADVTADGTSLSQGDRELLIGSYLLLRNGTSYVMLGNSDITWYPEYEIDLGGYSDELGSDLETLRVAGQGGGSGGLYLRKYVAGLVLVNSSGSAQSYDLPTAMKRASWSGGGDVAGDGTMPSYSLDYDTDVPAGALSVPAHSAVILRDPAGAPPPGEEPGSSTDGGVGGSTGSGGAAGSTGSGATTGTGASTGSGGATGSGGSGANQGNPSSSDDSGGCGCRVAPESGGEGALPALLLLFSLGLGRRKRRAC
jgi:MYXO-CTERM domain-containing protein